MSTFPKRIFGLIFVALAYAGIAYGQTIFCPSPSVVASTPKLRAEGTTEQTGTVVIGCAAGTTIGSGNLIVNFNAPITGGGTLLVIPASGPGTEYAASISGFSTTYTGVTFPASAFSLQIANFRVNASQISGAGGSTPVAVSESIVEVTDQGVGIFAPQPQTVGFVVPGFAAPAVSGVQNYQTCVGSPLSGAPSGNIRIAETFGGAFKTQNEESTNAQATHGTRFQLAFTNIATGVTLSVPILVTSGSLTMQLTASATGAISRLVSGVLSSSGGTATAYYEVTQTDDSQIESISIPVTATAAANFSNSAVSAFNVTVTPAPQNSADVPNFSTSTPASLAMSTYAVCGIPLTLTTTQPGVTSYPDDINVTYGPQFAAAGGTSPYTYSIFSGNLPPGQGINAATGEITGAATVAGDYTLTGKVVDSATPAPATATYSVTIHTLADPAVVTSAPPGGNVSAPYSTTLAASGGYPGYSASYSYTWSLVSGSLPPGLSLATATGIISGTPSATGTSNFTIGVTDAYTGRVGASGQRAMSIAIAAPLVSCAPFDPGAAANLLRIEGTIEKVADETINCAAGTNLPPSTVVVSLTLPVTSPVVNGVTDAWFIITPSNGPPVAYSGTVSGTKVTFSDVSFPAVAFTAATRNIRVNAMVGSPTPGLNGVLEDWSIITGGSTVFSSPQTGLVGLVIQGFGAATVTGVQNYTVCQGSSESSAAGVINISEAFGGAFKSQTPTGQDGTQLCGGAACNSLNGEQASYMPGGGIGAATHGTRFQLAFANIAAGVTLSVPASITGPTWAIQRTASAAGPFSAASGNLTVTAGVAFAYYEVTQTDDAVLRETLSIPVYATAAAGFSSPGVPAFTVAVTPAPQGSADIPNFSTTTPTPLTLSAYAACAPPPQSVTFAQPGNVTFGAPPVSLSASATSGLPVSFTSNSTGVCTASGTVASATIVGAGMCSITASQAGNAGFGPAPSVTNTFQVAKASQTITFAPLSPQLTPATPPFPLSAIASSGLPVSFSSNTAVVCTVSGITVTLLSAGTCTITASQAGDDNFNAAANAHLSLTVNSALTITCSPATGPSLAGANYSSTCTATSGTQPYSFFVDTGVLPNGLTLNSGTGVISGAPAAGGSYNYSIQVEDSGTPQLTASQAFSGRVASAITVAPALLQFTWRIGDATTPDPQAISVFTAPPGTRFTAAASATAGGTWLSIGAASSNATPGAFPVSINTTGLDTPGPLNGAVTITPTGGGAPVNVPVTLNVLAQTPAQLSAAPLSDTLAITQGASPAVGQITVSNTGGGTLPFTAVSDQPGWLTTSAAGSATSGSPGIVAFTVNPAGLNPGLNTGNITITGAGSSGQAKAAISAVLSQAADSINLTASSLNFTADASGPAPPGQSFTVADPGTGSLNWTAQTQTITGGTWLSVTPSGTSSGGQTGTPVAASISQTGLAPGQYYATINISAPGAANSPQTVSVLLTVNPSGTEGQGIGFSTGGLILRGAAGNGITSGQVSLFNPSNSTGSYSTTTTVNQGSGWLSVSPLNGTDGVLLPGVNTLAVQANLDSLSAGVYRGAVTVAFDDGTTGTVEVAVIATNGLSNSAKAGPAPRVTAACSDNQPGYLIPNFTQPLSQSVAQVAVGHKVQVQIVDDCNSPITPQKGGGGQVSFSNGDQPVSLTYVGNGLWEATWTPANAGTQVTLQVAALSSGTGQSRLTGISGIDITVSAPSSTGAAQLHGVVNAASGSTATPQIVAPGSYVAIYGILLSSGSPVAGSTLPLLTTLSDTQLLLGGQALPLSYSSTGQVNALIPQSLSPNTSYPLVVERGSTQSVPIPVSVVRIEPGIYTVNQSGTGPGVVQIANTSILAQPTANGSRPVHRGSEFLTIYATGLGAVVGTMGEPPPADGAPALLPAIYQTKASVTVTIGGVTVPASFSGLTPTLAALYQVNVQVPAGVPTGDAVPLTITATSPDGSIAQSNSVTIAVQ